MDRPLFAMHKPLGECMNVTDWRMVELDRLKYVWNRDDIDELFDLDEDPGERSNRINDPIYHRRLLELQALLSGFLRETDDPLIGVWPHG